MSMARRDRSGWKRTYKCEDEHPLSHQQGLQCRSSAQSSDLQSSELNLFTACLTYTRIPTKMSVTPSAAEHNPIRESFIETGSTRFEVLPSGASIAGVVSTSTMVIAVVTERAKKRKSTASVGSNMLSNENLSIVKNRDKSRRAILTYGQVGASGRKSDQETVNVAPGSCLYPGSTLRLEVRTLCVNPGDDKRGQLLVGMHSVTTRCNPSAVRRTTVRYGPSRYLLLRRYIYHLAPLLDPKIDSLAAGLSARLAECNAVACAIWISDSRLLVQ